TLEPLPGADGGREPRTNAAHPRVAAGALHAGGLAGPRRTRRRAQAAPQRATAPATAGGGQSVRLSTDVPRLQDAHPARSRKISAAHREHRAVAPVSTRSQNE